MINTSTITRHSPSRPSQYNWSDNVSKKTVCIHKQTHANLCIPPCLLGTKVVIFNIYVDIVPSPPDTLSTYPHTKKKPFLTHEKLTSQLQIYLQNLPKMKMSMLSKTRGKLTKNELTLEKENKRSLFARKRPQIRTLHRVYTPQL